MFNQVHYMASRSSNWLLQYRTIAGLFCELRQSMLGSVHTIITSCCMQQDTVRIEMCFSQVHYDKSLQHDDVLDLQFPLHATQP